jgi:RNA polymerase sigma-70 factor (sigma-E family)
VGVRAEFTSFYERESLRLVRTVTMVTGEPALAEEVVAEAFARAWSRWSKVRDHARPDAWIMRVAMNESRSRFRRRALERRLAHRVAQPELVHDPDPVVAQPLWDAVARLDRRERTLIALRYVAGLRQAEIADVLGIPPGTVASGLHRARRTLEDSLAPTHDEEHR